MRIDEESEYREGRVLNKPPKQGKGSLVSCGMRKVTKTPLYCLFLSVCWRKCWTVCPHLPLQDVRIDKQLQPGLRVTVKLSKTQSQGSLQGSAFSFPHRLETGQLTVCLFNSLQKTNFTKGSLWLLTCREPKVVFTGVTLSAWHPVSVSVLGPHVQRLAWISHWNMTYAWIKNRTQKSRCMKLCAHMNQAHFLCTSQSMWIWGHVPDSSIATPSFKYVLHLRHLLSALSKCMSTRWKRGNLTLRT